MLNLVSIAFWIWFGCFRDWPVAKLCKFRPSDPFSPRRELQESTQRLESSISLRRPRRGLGAPKRDHEENLYHFERDISPRREVLSFERWTLSPRWEWLA